MTTQPLVDCIGSSLAQQGFRPHWRPRMESLGCMAFWRRCTLNTNRAVALLQYPDSSLAIGPYCQQMKWRLLWLTRFCPLLYEVGLQIILCGDGLQQAMGPPEKLRQYVDNFSNQLVVLQSLFVADTASRRYAASRTWGQFITSPVQAAIDEAIKAAGYSHAQLSLPDAAAK